MQYLKSCSVVVTLCLLVACASVTGGSGGSVIVSETDPRAFRYLQLDNGLKVLLVSDPGADKAGASLDVHVGSRQDPKDYQGLAHFLEHMLFLGTEKYPNAGDYQAFISANGGQHNAFTSFEHTNYFFDISAGALEPALDQFAQFFIAPLFNAEYVQREVNAVNSEYLSRLRDDPRRELAVVKSQINPQHPFSKFSVGNLETLQAEREAELRAQLVEFYQRYYSANIMALTVVGRESLDDLQDMVASRFGEIANRGTRLEPISTEIFSADSLPRWVNIDPIQQQRSLSIQFAVPDATSHWRSKPLAYIGNLLGHEGHGSLLSELKSRGWAEGLSAGQSLDFQGQAMFGVDIQLTEQGVAQVDDVVALLFEAIELIRREGVEQWRFDEQSQLAAQQFRFRTQRGLTQELIHMSSALQKYPPAEVLRGDYRMDVYQPELLLTYLSLMTIDRAFMTLTAPGLKVDQHIARYNVDYGLRPVSAELRRRWQSADEHGLALPAANGFIASDFSLVAAENDDGKPRRLDSVDGVELWLHTDDRFEVPKARSYILLASPSAVDGAYNRAKTELWLSMVKDQLNELTYTAQLAGLSYSLRSNWRGIEISLGGYNQTQAKLLREVLTVLRAPEWDEERFSRLQNQAIRELENHNKKAPYQQLYAELPRLLQRAEPGVEDSIEALRQVVLSDLSSHVAKVVGDFRYQILVDGNVNEADAQGLTAIAVAALAPAKSASLADQEIVKLTPRQRRFPLQAEHDDAAALLYIQAPKQGKLDRVALGLAGQIMSADFYHQLRTEKQLGYIVNAGVYPIRDVGGLVFIVQSPVLDAAGLQREISGYLENWLAQGVSEDSFAMHKASLLAKLAEQPENLWDAADRHWRDLLEGYDRFDSREQLSAALESLDLATWQSRVNETLEPSQRRGVFVYHTGRWPEAQPTGVLVRSHGEFKATLPVYRFQ